MVMRTGGHDLEDWLAPRWVLGAGFMAAALLALAPALGAALTLPVLLILLHSPVYMVHQVEEHTGDRFRAFANNVMLGGRDGLTTASVLVINVGLVWGLNLAAFYLGLFFGAGYGLVAPYAMLVNALIHIAARLRLGVYNPGLVTALVLFLPLSVASLVVIGREPGVGWAMHALALALAIGLHLAIVAWVLVRLRRTGP